MSYSDAPLESDSAIRFTSKSNVVTSCWLIFGTTDELRFAMVHAALSANESCHFMSSENDRMCIRGRAALLSKYLRVATAVRWASATL